MSEAEVEMECLAIDRRKTDAVLALLASITEGPQEAYSVLCVCIHRINFEFCEKPISIDDLAEGVRVSMHSIKGHRAQ